MIVLRSALFHVYFYVTTAALASSSLVGRVFPWLMPRGWPHALARAWARTTLWGMRVICNLRYEVIGWENMPTEPVLIASMHQSAFDTIVWLHLLRDPAYVLKVELMRIPLFGAICRLTEMIVVDRGGGGATIRSLLKASDRVLANGRSVVIFPEGTRVAPGLPAPLHPGVAALASHTKLPVVPVLTDSGHFWGRRTFRRYPGVIRIVIQPPLPAGTPRAALMQALADQFAAGVPSPGPVDKSVGTVRDSFRHPGNS